MGAIFGKPDVTPSPKQGLKKRGKGAASLAASRRGVKKARPGIDAFKRLCDGDVVRSVYQATESIQDASETLLPKQAVQFLTDIGTQTDISGNNRSLIPFFDKSFSTQAFCYHAVLSLVKPQLIPFPRAPTVCETGYRGTHDALVPFSVATSITVFLSGLPPGARYYGFDLPETSAMRARTVHGKSIPLGAGGPNGIGPVTQRLNKTLFADRIFIHRGDSSLTIPRFLKRNPEFKCNTHPSYIHPSLPASHTQSYIHPNLSLPLTHNPSPAQPSLAHFFRPRHMHPTHVAPQ